MNIVVVGLGYVGLSNALMLSNTNQVTGVDLSEPRLELLKKRQMPIDDKEGAEVLKTANITWSNDLQKTLKNGASEPDYVFVATPTNFEPEINFFDTKSVDITIDTVIKNTTNTKIIIKSTIPTGYTKKENELHKTNRVYFSPEFLREGHSYYDLINPSRIIVGGPDKKTSHNIGRLLAENTADSSQVNFIFTGSTEAESIKLFANTYLAMRVAFFNEIDTFASTHKLNSADIIKGMSLDPRIGDFYNNPSFGYGGYCLPKDTKQAVRSFDGIEQSLISAIVKSNDARKNFITSEIAGQTDKNVIGIYRLAMKKDSDNFRASAILDIIKMLQEIGKTVIVYEPTVSSKTILDAEVINDLDSFKQKADIIVANRTDDLLADVDKRKIYTKSLFDSDV